MSTNVWAKGFVLLVVGFLLAAVVVYGNQAPPTQLQLLDLTGRWVAPLQATDAKATVFLFIRTECPVSNRYAPEIRRLYEKFASSGVTFWLVYPDSDESVETIRQHVEEYEYHFGVLRDPRQTLVRLAGVRVTPEAAVFMAGGRMVYRGRIDDRYVAFGKTRPAPTTHDLEQVLQAILEGAPVTSKTTPAIGCFISDLQ